MWPMAALCLAGLNGKEVPRAVTSHPTRGGQGRALWMPASGLRGPHPVLPSAWAPSWETRGSEGEVASRGARSCAEQRGWPPGLQREPPVSSKATTPQTGLESAPCSRDKSAAPRRLPVPASDKARVPRPSRVAHASAAEDEERAKRERRCPGVLPSSSGGSGGGSGRGEQGGRRGAGAGQGHVGIRCLWNQGPLPVSAGPPAGTQALGLVPEVPEKTKLSEGQRLPRGSREGAGAGARVPDS